MKIVVSMSGGLDSATLAAWLVSRGHDVRAVGINYGQRHRVELDYAMRSAAALGVPFQRIDIPNLGEALAGSCLTTPGMEVPKGHYADRTMRSTVVPNRNAILLSIVAGHAMAHRADAVALANHAGDHAVYPDCREEFVDAMRGVLRVAGYEPIELLAPFTHMDKADIAHLAGAVGVPLHLTYSCYEGQDGGGHGLHCGKCGTCYERREAIKIAGLEDPTTYVGSTPGLAEVEVREEFTQPDLED